VVLRFFSINHGIIFGSKQRNAITMASLNKRIFSLTGYAGTGKTSASKAILRMYEDKYGFDSIVCCALSGIAANRVKKQSGYTSSTIATLLGFDHAKGGFLHNEGNKLKQSVVLLDESSMVDVKTFDALLRAIDFETSNLILLGDPAQLPPVGAGELFSDLLEFGVIYNITLDKIYRQSDGNVITTFAQDVRNGNVPELRFEYEDFEFVDISVPGYWSMKNTLKPKEIAEINEQNNGKVIDYIVSQARNALPFINEANKRDAWEGLTRFQVIVPMKNGLVGTKNLNVVLQDVLNPKRDAIKDVLVILGSDREFRLRDKVIHLQNKKMTCVYADEFKAALASYREFSTFETKVFNGQIGILFKGNIEEDEYYVYYPNEGYVAIYSKGDFAGNIIDLAYALTGHKTQGSEFFEVVLPIVNAHWMMLNNKLLYTQMTRAKERLLIVGEKYVFSKGCTRNSETVRNTITKMRLKRAGDLYV
jgi:exodeoxyribonuclease V alpha subunit